MHVYALRSTGTSLDEQWFKEQRYKKYERQLGEKKALAEDVLRQEALACAGFLNSQEKLPGIGGQAVKALAVLLG